MSSSRPRLAELVDDVTARTRGDGDALGLISTAEEVAADLHSLGQRVVGYFIERARADGYSWSEIGSRIGVSRQAAQQRYSQVQSCLSLDDLRAAGALSRVTPRTQEVLRRAERHARRRGDADLDGAHILLAILETPNVAVAALKTLGVRAARVRRALKGLPTRPRAPVQDHVPIRVGAAARRCLEGALSEALGLGHNYIGTEHLVLGILHVDRSSAARALHAEGVTLESARRAVQHAISDYLRTRT